MYLRLLGTISLSDEAGADALRDSSQPKRLALLAYLAIAARSGFVRRDTILALFWPEATEKDARRSLNQAVHYLRSLAGADVVVSRGADLIGVDERLGCDVNAFDEAIAAGDAERALELYRGPLMEGFVLNGMPEFEEWLARERTSRARKASDAAWTLAESQPNQASALALGDRAYALLADEGASRRLIALHDRWGDRAGALHIYEALAARLRDEYGADVAPETRALVDAVRRRDTRHEGAEREGRRASSKAIRERRRGWIWAGAAAAALLLVVGARLMLGGSGAPSGTSAALDTKSEDARKAYVAGESDYIVGRYRSAEEWMRRAIAADTDFAMGYYGLANAANWLGDMQLQAWAVEHMTARLNRVPDSERRRISAWVQAERGDIGPASASYEKLLKANPRDADALFQLADLRFHWGPTVGIPLASNAADWDAVIRVIPNNGSALQHAARVAAARGDTAGFDRIAARFARLDPDPERDVDMRVLRAFAFGTHADRLAAIRDVPTMGAGLRDALGLISAVSPTLADVDDGIWPTLYTNLFANREDGNMMLQAQLQLARGHLRAASVTLDSAAMLNATHALEYRAVFASLPLTLSTADDRRTLRAALAAERVPPSRSTVMRQYLLGLLAVRDGDTTEALARAAALETSRSSSAEDTAYARRTALILRAEVLRQHGAPARALEVLGDPQTTPDHQRPHVWSYSVAHERFLRGELLEDLRRPADALRWYETFSDPRGYDVMYRPAALYRRASLEEELGRPQAAASDYRALLALWGTADGAMAARVNEVRTRLRLLIDDHEP